MQHFQCWCYSYPTSTCLTANILTSAKATSVLTHLIKGKEFLATLSKYYVSDLGLRQMILGNRNIDMGHILENIIYLELLRRKTNVYVGQFDKNEIDFVVINSNEVEYYQVALTVLDENTLKRELAAFKNIKDNYPKYLITLDDVLPNTDYDGIKVINALEWLLGE